MFPIILPVASLTKPLSPFSFPLGIVLFVEVKLLCIEWENDSFLIFFTSNLSHRRIRRMSLLSQHLFSLWQEDGIVPASPGVSERWGGLGFWVVFSSARWHPRVVFFGRCCRLIGVGLRRRRGDFRGARPSVKSSRRDGCVWLANRWTLLFWVIGWAPKPTAGIRDWVTGRLF